MPKTCKECKQRPAKPTYLYCNRCIGKIIAWCREQNQPPITYTGASGQETRQVSTHDVYREDGDDDR